GKLRPITWDGCVVLRGDFVERFQETLCLITEMGNDSLHQHALRCVGALVKVIERQVHDAADVPGDVELREGVKLIAKCDQCAIRVERAFRMGTGAGRVDDRGWVVGTNGLAASDKVICTYSAPELDQLSQRK